MITNIIAIVSSGIGCTGFALIFNTKMNRILYAGISSMAITFVYILLSEYSDNQFFTKMICAFLATAYAEAMARIAKAPSSVFLLPPIMSLVPGGYLYYTMYGLVISDSAMVKTNANATILSSMGIAVGIVIVSVILSFMESFKKRRPS